MPKKSVIYTLKLLSLEPTPYNGPLSTYLLPVIKMFRPNDKSLPPTLLWNSRNFYLVNPTPVPPETHCLLAALELMDY